MCWSSIWIWIVLLRGLSPLSAPPRGPSPLTPLPPPPTPPHRERGTRLMPSRTSPSSPGVGGGRGREKRAGVMRVLGGGPLKREGKLDDLRPARSRRASRLGQRRGGEGAPGQAQG